MRGFHKEVTLKNLYPTSVKSVVTLALNCIVSLLSCTSSNEQVLTAVLFSHRSRKFFVIIFKDEYTVLPNCGGLGVRFFYLIQYF